MWVGGWCWVGVGVLFSAVAHVVGRVGGLGACVWRGGAVGARKPPSVSRGRLGGFGG